MDDEPAGEPDDTGAVEAIGWGGGVLDFSAVEESPAMAGSWEVMSTASKVRPTTSSFLGSSLTGTVPTSICG